MKRLNRLAALERLEFREFLHAGTVASEVASATTAEGEDEAVPEFSLVDVNPSSATYNQAISPRDHLGHVSAWYFGHAT